MLISFNSNISNPALKINKTGGQKGFISSNPSNPSTTLPIVPYNYFSKITFKGYENLEDRILPKIRSYINSNSKNKKAAGAVMISELPMTYVPEFLNHKDNSIKIAALQAIGKNTSGDGLELIKPLLDPDKTDFEVYIEAVKALAHITYDEIDCTVRFIELNPEESLEKLKIARIDNAKKIPDIDELLASESVNKRRAGALLVGKIQEQDITKLEPLFKDPSEKVIKSAIDGVVLRQDPKLSEMLKPLTSSKNAEVAKHAARGIGNLGDINFLFKNIDKKPEIMGEGVKEYLKYNLPHSEWD